MACAGATYLFGTYSKDIKSTLGYDQTTLNLLGFFKDLDNESCPDSPKSRTWFVLVIGSAMNFVGTLIWLKGSSNQRVNVHLHRNNSQNFANTGALVTCVRTVPKEG
ncbi:hypothetical protein Bca52824_010147 [Brassica carinata]|uniref:Nodulin-like domain-containing protein n=1 Tax=Brassica carinata TaxID=52824 RepID=A0A8X7WB83_BRACI|nr:hypothetical protein Bca52824_010142 [Brassica carinata]KAG2327419.1 hypothetical protein Bca52824_010147 [Brassica carinata]